MDYEVENPYVKSVGFGHAKELGFDEGAQAQRKADAEWVVEQGLVRLPENPELLAGMLKQLAEEHKRRCHNPDCSISLSLLGQVYKCLVQRELTVEEVARFC